MSLVCSRSPFLLVAGIFVVLTRGSFAQSVFDLQPHIAYTGVPGELSIAWQGNNCSSPYVAVRSASPFGLQQGIYATSRPYNETTLHTSHVARLGSLRPGELYRYQIGCNGVLSDALEFTYLQNKPGGAGYKFVIYGDLGYYDGNTTLGALQRIASTPNSADMIWHIGDLAYQLSDLGDEFMTAMAPVVSKLPYQVAAGNHEFYVNSAVHYVNRFDMPGNTSNFYYSFDVGLTHFVIFLTEIINPDFLEDFTGVDVPTIDGQYAWLKADLQRANANRANVPWLVVMGHQPMYCTTEDDPVNCDTVDNKIRTTDNLETLFYDAGVDFLIFAHEHNYQRYLPIYNFTVYNTSRPYDNPPAPVHIVTGAAGNLENQDAPGQTPSTPAVAFFSEDYSISWLNVVNSTHAAFWQQRSSDDATIDSFVLIKDSHGPYTSADLARLRTNGVSLINSLPYRF